MFISNKERDQIQKDIQSIGKMLNDMNAEILYLTAKIKVLEGNAKKKKGMSPESRAKMSTMMKERHAKKKMEKENGNSISTTSI